MNRNGTPACFAIAFGQERLACPRRTLEQDATAGVPPSFRCGRSCITQEDVTERAHHPSTLGVSSPLMSVEPDLGPVQDARDVRGERPFHSGVWPSGVSTHHPHHRQEEDEVGLRSGRRSVPVRVPVMVSPTITARPAAPFLRCNCGSGKHGHPRRSQLGPGPTSNSIPEDVRGAVASSRVLKLALPPCRPRVGRPGPPVHYRRSSLRTSVLQA